MWFQISCPSRRLDTSSTSQKPAGALGADERKRPSYRHRSPTIFAVLIQLGHQLLEDQAFDRLAFRRRTGTPHRRTDPAFADPPLNHALMSGRSPRDDFGDWATAEGDDHGFAGGRGATYSLSLFFRVLRPTVRISAKWLPEALCQTVIAGRGGAAGDRETGAR